MKEGAKESWITQRHFRRLVRRYAEEGGRGLTHKSRGKKSRNAFLKDTEKEILKFLKECYYDFGPTFAAKKLEGIKLSEETMRKWLIEERI